MRAKRKTLDRREVAVAVAQAEEQGENRGQIRWGDEEIELLAEALVAMRDVDPVANMASFIGPAMEEVLEPDRRRPHISGMSQMPPRLLERIQAMLQDRAALVERGRRPDPEPPPPPPPPPSPAEIVGKMPTRELLALVSLRLFAHVDDTVHRMETMEGDMKSIKALLGKQGNKGDGTANGQQVGGNGVHHPQANGVAAKLSPDARPGTNGTGGHVVGGGVEPIRVCIVGLLGGQQNVVRQRAPKTVQLMFISQDAHEPKFPSSAEWIVLVKKFVKHNWTTAAFQARERDKVFHVDGGITVLIQKLCDIGSRQRPSHKPT